VFKNKLDEFRTVTWNKARLVVHGYNQEKEIDYEETFAILISLGMRMLIMLDF